ncbi:MAG: PadR family transcriptional regulator [Anaerolineae bacterium]|nr:PadR family transcriptional regulator [Anaerolineae bacterium]
MLKYILLGGLYTKPLTGYQIKQFMENATSHFWYAQTSQIYRTLDQLEKEGLVTSQIQEQHDKPDRRIYHITNMGRADLRGWLETPLTNIEPTKDTLLLKLYFSAQLDKETVLTQLRLQRALHKQQLAHLVNVSKAQIEQGIQANPALKRDGLMWEITRRNGELFEEAYIRWLDEAIERIEAEF